MKPYTDDELLILLNDLESDLTERKESLSGDVPKKARQAICAFANDLPDHRKAGVLFIGVKDNGETSGLTITDELLRRLTDMRGDGNILPLPLMTVEKRLLKGTALAVITVQPSDMPPVRYEGRIWIRTGPRRAIANEQEERILNEKRRYKALPYDLYPVANASVDDLSLRMFENEYLPAAFAPDILEANRRTYEQRLVSCRMISTLDSREPTVTGLLTIGITPQDFLPGARIQFLRINGNHLTDGVVDEMDCTGTLGEQLRKVEEKLVAHNRIGVHFDSGLVEIRTSDYPLVALRQIVSNAILHRTYENTYAPVKVYWYNDRIEVISPGGPFGNVTPQNFGHPGITDYRNPNLADALKTLGFVQRFGMGIALAQKAMQENGNPPVEFAPDQSTVLATLRKRL